MTSFIYLYKCTIVCNSFSVSVIVVVSVFVFVPVIQFFSLSLPLLFFTLPLYLSLPLFSFLSLFVSLSLSLSLSLCFILCVFLSLCVFFSCITQIECLEKYDDITFGMFVEVFGVLPLFAVRRRMIETFIFEFIFHFYIIVMLRIY